MRTVLVVLLLAGLTACGSSGPDTAAWKSDLAAKGVTPPDWAHYVQTVKSGVCSEIDYDYFIAAEVDAKQDPDVDRIGIKYQCPSHLKAWDKSMASVADTQLKAARICGTPRDELSESDQEYYDAVC